MADRVNICRPGYGASCALCCGSHNYRGSGAEVGELFARRAEVLAGFSRSYITGRIAASRSAMTGSYYYSAEGEPFALSMPAIFEDCPRCHFVGYVDDDRHVGCILYPHDRPADLRHDCFQSYPGKVFTCSASEELADREILYAARLARDWFYYSLLIHAPERLRAVMKEHPDPGMIPDDELDALRRELDGRVSADCSLHSIHTYFY
ncbi:MAG: hypothetical protein JW807_17215 [Spirochaetes bacterium]|nr:hypothetical protein [Spirochaetota bacterium]